MKSEFSHPRVVSTRPSPWRFGLLVTATWLAVAAIMTIWPDKSVGFIRPAHVRETNDGVLFFAVALLVVVLTTWTYRQPGILQAVINPLRRAGKWLLAFAVMTGVWSILTDKLAWLPQPFFPAPHALVDVWISDGGRIADCVLHSLRLLGLGFFIGSVWGFITGVAIGWSHRLGYWVHPVLRFIGPLPATALLPVSLYLFPSSFAAAIFLIALATWFPVTVLTWSGVANVPGHYYDVARTLGADTRFLILHVAIPAALPNVFVGLFMGLGASFSVLVAAEMMGVKSGLGWYLQWAQGWAAYANMYAALIVMALLFSSLIKLLFMFRARVLAWQDNTVRW
ncbi:TPA: ABC transporter permease [Raoultella planticola]